MTHDSEFLRDMKAAYAAFLNASNPAERKAGIKGMEDVLRQHFGARPALPLDEPENAHDHKMAAAGKD